MSLLLLTLGFELATYEGPVDEALRATEAPISIRAAFTAEINSPTASRTIIYDPRRSDEARWQELASEGEDEALDRMIEVWSKEPAPDARLFPDALRDSLGETVAVDDLGAAWRLVFDHAPSFGDRTFDIWADEALSANAWLEPEGDRFLRLDFRLDAAQPGPDGGELTRFDQSYFLEQEPVFGLSFVAGYSVNFEAQRGVRDISQSYEVRISYAEIYFSASEPRINYVIKPHLTVSDATVPPVSSELHGAPRPRLPGDEQMPAGMPSEPY